MSCNSICSLVTANWGEKNAQLLQKKRKKKSVRGGGRGERLGGGGGGACAKVCFAVSAKEMCQRVN